VQRGAEQQRRAGQQADEIADGFHVTVFSR
jgi:hypothetical protein